MAAPIGGASPGMDAIGSALAAGPGAQGSATPPAQASGAGAAGMDAQRQQLMAGMTRIRDLGEQCKQIATEYPMTAEAMMQIQQLLKQAVISMAPQAPMQTMSGQAVPGGGM